MASGIGDLLSFGFGYEATDVKEVGYSTLNCGARLPHHSYRIQGHHIFLYLV